MTSIVSYMEDELFSNKRENIQQKVKAIFKNLKKRCAEPILLLGEINQIYSLSELN